MNAFAEGEAKKALLSPAWQTGGVGKGEMKNVLTCITRSDPGKPSPTSHASMQGGQQPSAPGPTGYGAALHFPGDKHHLFVS